jgi:hypothetical protein
MSKAKHVKARSESATNLSRLVEYVNQTKPVTFRMPKLGTVDPFFGLDRNAYYSGAKKGHWKLIKLLDPGKRTGRTLVPFEQVAAFIERQSANGGAE